MKGPSMESRLCIPIEAKVLHKWKYDICKFKIAGVLMRISVIIQDIGS